MRILVPVAVAALFSIFTQSVIPAQAQGLTQPDARATLSVSGQGDHQAAPDMALIRVGVVTQAKTAKAALASNSAKMREATQTLKAAGIASRDLQTSNLSLQPLWSSRSSNSGSPPVITGFSARNTLSVRVRDLEKLGRVLDATIGAGANEFNGLSFLLSDPVPAADAARAAAVADALRKARVLADAAGVTLGPILSISESGGRPRPVAMEMARASLADAVPIEAGEVSVGASVSIVFAID